MSRNGSGTHSIPNTLVSGEVIEASDHNENYSDISAEITNSVAVDGQSTMTGALKLSNGTVGAPAAAFGSDTDTGLYRIGSNNLGVAVGGTKIVDVASTGATVTGDMNATTIKQNSIALLPAGVIFPYGGTSAPSGYLLCYGQDVSRTTYSALFTAIGTSYGVGDGSTTFTIPDLRGRVAAGKDDMGGSSANRLTDADDGINGDTLGDTGGGETQTLVTGNLPAHTPAGSVALAASGGGAATGLLRSAAGVAVTFGTVGTAGDGVQAGTGALNTITASFTGTPQGGTSTAFGVVQPTIILNYIIFAGV